MIIIKYCYNNPKKPTNFRHKVPLCARYIVYIPFMKILVKGICTTCGALKCVLKCCDLVQLSPVHLESTTLLIKKFVQPGF